jgi:hypothetical protein
MLPSITNLSPLDSRFFGGGVDGGDQKPAGPSAGFVRYVFKDEYGKVGHPFERNADGCTLFKGDVKTKHASDTLNREDLAAKASRGIGYFQHFENKQTLNNARRNEAEMTNVMLAISTEIGKLESQGKYEVRLDKGSDRGHAPRITIVDTKTGSTARLGLFDEIDSTGTATVQPVLFFEGASNLGQRLDVMKNLLGFVPESLDRAAHLTSMVKNALTSNPPDGRPYAGLGLVGYCYGGQKAEVSARHASWVFSMNAGKHGAYAYNKVQIGLAEASYQRRNMELIRLTQQGDVATKHWLVKLFSWIGTRIFNAFAPAKLGVEIKFAKGDHSGRGITVTGVPIDGGRNGSSYTDYYNSDKNSGDISKNINGVVDPFAKDVANSCIATGNSSNGNSSNGNSNSNSSNGKGSCDDNSSNGKGSCDDNSSNGKGSCDGNSSDVKSSDGSDSGGSSTSSSC